MCFLILTAIALWYFLRTFGFSTLESILGTLLFLDCTPVVQQSGFPMIDPSAYFFMILGFLAIRLDLPLLLMSAAAIGVFAKETTFALIFAALLTDVEKPLFEPRIHRKPSVSFLARVFGARCISSPALASFGC